MDPEDRQKGASSPSTAQLHDNTRSPRDDRRLRGKILREAIPRETHAGWKLPPDRPDPISLLEKSNEGRLPELIPLRYGRMLESPFTFYRGSAALMAADLATTPSTGVRVQACGDCHLMNFGAFGTPERNIVFDINDFDETLPGPWEWDLKRLAVSAVLAARDNGLKPKAAVAAAEAAARAYREKTAEFSRMTVLDIWYAKFDWQTIIESTFNEDLQKRWKQRLKREKERGIAEYYFPKMVEAKDGQFRIKDSPPVVYHPSADNFDDHAQKALERYRASLQEDRRRLIDRYRLADVAIKVVGIGSVGTLCAVALMLAPDNEPLFLQVKEARPSVLEPYAGASEFANRGRRVVEGQRIMQSASDMLLGWTETDDGRHFYVRQLRDMKLKLEPEFWDGDQLVDIAGTTGSVLARAHARSGDAAIISGYLGTSDTFDKAIADFATSYADQVEKDHAALLAAVRSGRIKATVEEGR